MQVYTDNRHGESKPVDYNRARHNLVALCGLSFATVWAIVSIIMPFLMMAMLFDWLFG